MTFRDLGLIAPILSALEEQGYTRPSPIQEKAIPPALEGRDVLGCAQTGTGKTCAFAAPILQRLSAAPVKGRPIRALILTPTRELAIQIGDSFQAYGSHLSLRHAVIFGGVGQNPQVEALNRGVDILEERLGGRLVLEEGVREHIASACGGDIRKAMNALELLASAARRENGALRITLEDAQTAAQKSAMRYDREGDSHFDIASALMKSLRGSDPDAALHYLARLLEAGDLISACRRLMVIACEDVGLAYPQIIPIVKACVDAANMLGLPEARIPLGDAAVLMATSPKSNSAHIAFDAALADVRAGKTGDYPRHLQNKHADSAGMEREQGYLYPHDFPHHWVRQQYLPDSLLGTRYYTYAENKAEQAAKRYWEEIKGPDF